MEAMDWGAWKRVWGLRANLLWGPVIEALQLFLPPSLMPSIKYWYLKVCAWHSPHIGKLSTDVVVPFLQVLHRTLLRIKTWGMGWGGTLRGTWKGWPESSGPARPGVRHTGNEHQLTLNCWWSYRSWITTKRRSKRRLRSKRWSVSALVQASS